MEYIEIKKDKCAGCGLCEEVLPELFYMKNNSAECRKGSVPEELLDRLEELADECPSEAIEIKNCEFLSICTDGGES